jgi:hypothetical protein
MKVMAGRDWFCSWWLWKTCWWRYRWRAWKSRARVAMICLLLMATVKDWWRLVFSHNGYILEFYNIMKFLGEEISFY